MSTFQDDGSRIGSGGVAAVLGESLDRLARGRLARRPLALRLWDGSELPATAPRPSSDDQPEPTLVVRSPRALEYILREPNQIGVGRAWVSGELELEGELEAAFAAASEGLRDVRLGAGDRLRLARAARRLGALHARAPRPPACEARVRGAGRLHSPARDRVAVRHHYDVPTAFYRLVLGPSLVYSCACFDAPGESLELAQERKLDLLCRKLELDAGERLLDVGCGWGSLVLHAARNYGVRAVGVTLSESQAAEARRRIREAGLDDVCEIRVTDYRDLHDGPYDKVVSVGMYEHVGSGQLPAYAARLARLVRPGGLVLNSGITRVAPARRARSSFIDRYVFPDGDLHPIGRLLDAMHGAELEVRDVESLREHYALTLRHWVANLERAREAAVAIAGEERERVWRLYMAASAVAFERGELGLHQTLAVRPGAPHPIPLRCREWIAR